MKRCMLADTSLTEIVGALFIIPASNDFWNRLALLNFRIDALIGRINL